MLFRRITTLRASLSKRDSYAFSLQTNTEDSDDANVTLSDTAQRALWAYKYILHIRDAKPRTCITQPSLREQLLSIQRPTQLYEFSSKVKQQMQSYFKGGVQINQEYFSQTRIHLAKQIQEQKLSKFIFSPSILITNPIFRSLLQMKFDFMISGGLGIGKTSSIILFMLLSCHVNKFIFDAANKKDARVQLEFLRKQGLLEISIPRYWYWSVDPNKDTGKSQFVQNLVTLQTRQFSKGVKENLLQNKDFFNFSRQFDSVYPRSINRGVIIDQIDTITSLMRQYNRRSQQTEQGSQENHACQQIYQLRNQSGELRIVLRNLIKIGKIYALSSTEAIEEQLIKTNKYNDQMMSLNLEDHKQLLRHKIAYLEDMEKKEAQIDFWQTFWFQFERRLPKELSEAEIKEMQGEFYSEVQQEKPNYFSRFLFVRQYFEKEENHQKYIQKFKDKKINKLKQNSFSKIAEDFTTFSLEKYREKIVNYLHKGKEDPVKLAIILYFFSHALKQAHNKKGQRQRFRVELKDLQDSLKICYAKETIQRIQIKYILPFQFINKGCCLEFQLNAELFLSAIYPALYAPLRDLRLTAQEMQGFNNYSFLGVILEHSLLEAMTEGAVVRFSPANCAPEQFAFKISKRPSVTPFNPKYIVSPGAKEVGKRHSEGHRKFKAQLESLMQQCREKPESFVLATPLCSIQRRHSGSACVDFLLMKLEGEKFKVYTFDATVQSRISDKASSALACLEQLFRGDERVEVKHTILCSEDDDVPIKHQTQKVVVICCPWNRVSVERTNNAEALRSFNQIRKAIQLVKVKHK